MPLDPTAATVRDSAVIRDWTAVVPVRVECGKCGTVVIFASGCPVNSPCPGCRNFHGPRTWEAA